MPRGVPRPTVLKVLAGEQKSKINDDEPQPDIGRPICPSANPEVNQVWDYTIRQLERMQIVTMVDRDLLHAYCVAVVTHRQASYVLAEEGLFVTGSRGGTVRHPAFNVAKEAAAQMKSIGMQFGLTPTSRSTIRVADQKKGREVGAARLLTG